MPFHPQGCKNTIPQIMDETCKKRKKGEIQNDIRRIIKKAGVIG